MDAAPGTHTTYPEAGRRDLRVVDGTGCDTWHRRKREDRVGDPVDALDRPAVAPHLHMPFRWKRTAGARFPKGSDRRGAAAERGDLERQARSTGRRRADGSPGSIRGFSISGWNPSPSGTAPRGWLDPFPTCEPPSPASAPSRSRRPAPPAVARPGCEGPCAGCVLAVLGTPGARPVAASSSKASGR